MATAKLDHVIRKGTTYRRTYQLKQANGQPINLTGFTIRGKVRHTEDSPSYVDLGTTIVDPAQGIWGMLLTVATSRVSMSTGVYEVEVEAPVSLEVTPVMFGNMLFLPEVV